MADKYLSNSQLTKGWVRRTCPLWLAFILGMTACSQKTEAPRTESAVSAVSVSVGPSGPATIKTQTSEFEVLPSGYIRAGLRDGGHTLTLDEPGAAPFVPGDFLAVRGKEVREPSLDLEHARISSAETIPGVRGKRIEITSQAGSAGASPIEKRLTIEVYDDFPNLALSTVTYKNTGASELEIDEVTTQHHRLNASLVDSRALPYNMWSFHGSSYEWGTGDMAEVSKGFSQANVMGAMSPRGQGGGVPVVAFWTKSVGVAVGHAETQPLVLSIPAKVDREGRVDVRLSIPQGRKLAPGESLSTPWTFVAVYAGDFFEPLRMYSLLLQRRGWKPAQPNSEDYNANWCGWGYMTDVTPAQMLGTIPKLHELGFKWATLDYRWFDTFGDWEPRPSTFPDDSLKKLVDEFHRQGIKLQLWWVPLAVGDGQVWEPIGEEEKTPAALAEQRRVARVVEEHPDWLILDKNQKHARIFLNRAALCPALPEVQEYYRKLVERFIGQWGFDGHKLDMSFTVPACYNPKHHHKSPEESVLAMGKVFKVIYETTQRLKPDSVTQVCPCGTPPNIAWLPYLDQAVTADPVGAVQVRERIKMYKALLGPEAAVYGDHVELSEMVRRGKEYSEVGKDFASTVGAGGVLGTKFTWPDYGPKFKNVYLTPEKEAYWKKWTGIYNAKMLSRGTFLDLYTLGYDVPEGYAIAKDGKMYYAFFAPEAGKPWKGEVELRGLEPGKYHVFDYENSKDLGTVDGANPKLAAEFTQHLLLEVSKL
jgi:alpha-galactosidase